MNKNFKTCCKKKTLPYFCINGFKHILSTHNTSYIIEIFIKNIKKLHFYKK